MTEWSILCLIARGVNSTDADRELREALRLCTAWERLIELATVQRMLAPLAHYVLRLEPYAAPRWARYVFRDLVALNAARIRCYQSVLAQVVAGLRQVGVSFLATKGVVFYGSYPKGCRQASFDIDLMIHPRDRGVMAQALGDLGLVQGQYHPESGTIRPHDRREQILYALHPDHMLRFGVLTDDPVLPCAEIDVANSMTWTKSNYIVSLDEVFERRQSFLLDVNGGNVQVPCMHMVHTLVHTAFHLFREAWFARSSYGVNLRKFADVFHAWSTLVSRQETGELAAYLSAADIQEPICWVLEHMDRTLGTTAVELLGLKGRVSVGFLAGAYGRQGQLVYWHGDMQRRLLDHGLELELSDNAPIE